MGVTCLWVIRCQCSVEHAVMSALSGDVRELFTNQFLAMGCVIAHTSVCQ